ncbi:MAG: slipin family protein [Thermoanaerobaculia bacterium]|nr:slipin family protein [Thermoanaerobaculia bacterium]
MLFIRHVRVQPYQRVVVFRDGEPIRLLEPGRHLFAMFARNVRLRHFDVREPYLDTEDLEALIKSGLLSHEVEHVRLQRHEKALVWIDGRLDRVVGQGLHAAWNSFLQVRFQTFSVLDVFVQHPDLEVLVDSGLLSELTDTVEIGDRQRALVWIDGRFERVLEPGLHVLWTTMKRVRVDLVDVGDGIFKEGQTNREEIETVLQTAGTSKVLEAVYVDEGHEALLFRDGRFDRSLEPGVYALWKNVARFRTLHVDLREQMLDVTGQDVMTADKVTLRVNAVVTFQVADARRAVEAAEDFSQALYREAQLALRAVIGTRELDVLLSEKDQVTDELNRTVDAKAAELGLQLVSLGLRDLILPGEMRALMNRVTEAKKAAEANLVTRREETQAMRSQANTARLFESNPTLLKLRELEVLEKVAEHSDLKVILTENGLADRLVKMV